MFVGLFPLSECFARGEVTGHYSRTSSPKPTDAPLLSCWVSAAQMHWFGGFGLLVLVFCWLASIEEKALLLKSTTGYLELFELRTYSNPGTNVLQWREKIRMI